MSWAGGGGEHSLRVKPQGSQGPPRQVNQSLGPAGEGEGSKCHPPHWGTVLRGPSPGHLSLSLRRRVPALT